MVYLVDMVGFTLLNWLDIDRFCNGIAMISLWELVKQV